MTNYDNMKEADFAALSATVLRNEVLKQLGVEGGISRTPKAELVKMAVELSARPEVKKLNKSELLRKEIKRRARAKQSQNSGELMLFMAEEHNIVMSRQFVVNVRNRFLTAFPELA